MKWKARYNDASEINQYNEDGSENSYDNLDRDKLSSFVLYNGDKKVLDLHLDEDQRLIYRRRVEMRTGEDQVVCYLVGWQQKVGNKNIQSIAYIFEDGRIELAGVWKDNHE